jgi:oligopeptide/dipeptide ABC transporter ATP-binding protein
VTESILELRRLVKHFQNRTYFLSGKFMPVQAVNGVDLAVKKGETLGFVCESGCGKSTLARLIVRLISPTSGMIFFDGQDLLALSATELRQARKNIQMIFQDPYSSLDPRMTVGDIVGEPMFFLGMVKDVQKRRTRVLELLENVGLDARHLQNYPHEFSGGQRQRISIARALATCPKLVVCDEPVSALDMSVRSQVLNLLTDLQEQFSLTYIFITHDLSVAEHMSNRIAVMYLGNIVEIAPKANFYRHHLHPYTRALLSAVPDPDPTTRRKRVTLRGDVPTAIDPPSGCVFHPRCPNVTAGCEMLVPELKNIGGEHFVRCHLYKGNNVAVASTTS